MSIEYLSIPTAALESMMLTAIVDAKEEQHVMGADLPNTFIQTKMPYIEYGEDCTIMKITGVLMNLLVEMAP